MKLTLYGEPNSLVKAKQKKRFSTKISYKPLFHFNADGEYIFESDDMKLIDRLKSKFAFKENIEEVIAEVIETENNATTGEEIKTIRHCKKCDYSSTNQGEMMAHYRECHPKNKDD